MQNEFQSNSSLPARDDQEAYLLQIIAHQSTLTRILQVAQDHTLSLPDVLDAILICLEQVPWLGPDYTGLVHLVESEGRLLLLKASHHADPKRVLDISSLCTGDSIIMARAARNREVSVSLNPITDQDTEGKGLLECSVPLIESNEVVGVLSIHLPEFQLENEVQLRFLDALGTTMAMIIRRKQAEALRCASEARVQAVVDSALDGIITIDTLGIMESINRAAAEILGYTVGNLIDKPLRLLLPMLRSEQEVRDWLESLVGTRSVEIEGEHRDGHRLPLDVSVAKVDFAPRRLFVMTFRDITQRKQVLKELVRARDAAEDANQAKSLFLATMSHELRTPLNSVIGFTNILLKNPDRNLTQEQLEHLNRVVKNGHQLLGLINDVLDLSKIDAGIMEPVWTDVALAHLLREIIEPHKKSRPYLSFHIEIPDHLLPLQSDANRLRQILENLIGNAAKFTEAGEVRVLVACDQDGHAQAICIADTGIGIPATSHAAVFEAFTQVDGSMTRKYQGTGLGLTISRHLAELMGYRILLASVPGKGSTFTLDLLPEKHP